MSPSLQTMGFFMSDINFCNTKEQLTHLGEVVTGKVDGSPTGADIDTSTLPYTGQVRKTLPALEEEYQADIDNFVQVSDQLIVDKTAEFDASIASKEAEADAAIDSYRLLSKGDYAPGILLSNKFEFVEYNGESYFATNPPYTTTATTPDADGNLFISGYATLASANEITHAGDSQIAGSIWPVNVDSTAQVGDDLDGYNRIRLSGGDFQDVTLFPFIRPDLTTESLRGSLVSVNLTTKPYTLTTDEETVYLLNGLEWDRPYAGRPITALWCVGDGVTDNADCLKLFMARWGGRWFAPKGDYYSSETINIQKTIHISGEDGGDAAVNYSTVFTFADDVVGFMFHRSDTSADDAGSPVYPNPVTTDKGAAGSVLSSCYVRRGNGSPPTSYNGKHGIWMKCRAEVDRCKVDGFGGHNIAIIASSQSTDAELRGNANNWKLSRVRTQQSAGDGVYVLGSDTNAGHGEMVNAAGNAGWGVNDSSFLGNVWTALHTNNNASGPYTTTNANCKSTFSGYSEGNQPPAVLNDRSLAIGGLQGAGVVGPHLFADAGQFSINVGIISNATNSGGELISSQLGGNADAGQILLWASSEESNVWRLQKVGDDYAVRFANSSNNVPFEITGENTTEDAGTSNPIPYLFHSESIGLGAGNNLRRVTYRDSIPTSGEYARGDIIFSRAASPSGNVGWICTTAGVAGSTAVFKSWGAISA